MAIASGTAALIAAGVGAAGSIASGVMSSSSAKSAASTAAASSDRAAAVQEARYNQTRDDLMPFTQSGQSAVGRLNALFGLSAPQAAPAPAPVAQPQTFAPAMTGNSGNTGNGGLPEGTRFMPPEMASNGESGSYQIPGRLVDTVYGNIIAEGNTLQEAMSAAGLSAPQVTQQQVQQQPAPQMQPASAGAMPGAGSSVTPYAPPNGGVFTPAGGTDFTGQTEFRLTPEQLAATPGYQFALSEGNKGIMASSAARGGLLSGASIKAAQRFATGLADNTYMNQASVFGQNYNRAATQFGDNYNRQNNLFATNLNASTALNDQYFTRNISPLFDLAKMGAGAATQTGQIGSDSARAAGGFIQAGGVNQASGQMAASNAMTGGFSQAANNLLYGLGRYNTSQNQWADATDTGGWDY
jgi:hypothetical protein